MHRNEALAVYETEVAAEWVDYNGHMNDAAYALVFSRSVDALMDRIGLDAASRKASRRTLFTLQMMLHYFQEASEGQPLFVRCHLLEHDDKRMRVWLEMKAGRRGRASPPASNCCSPSIRTRRARAPRPGAPRPWPRSTRWPTPSAASKSRRWRGRGWR